MARKISNIRNGIPIRAINLSTGDHMDNEISVTISWWNGEYIEDNESYGNRGYWNVSHASARRVSKFILGENNA